MILTLNCLLLSPLRAITQLPDATAVDLAVATLCRTLHRGPKEARRVRCLVVYTQNNAVPRHRVEASVGHSRRAPLHSVLSQPGWRLGRDWSAGGIQLEVH